MYCISKILVLCVLVSIVVGMHLEPVLVGRIQGRPEEGFGNPFYADNVFGAILSGAPQRDTISGIQGFGAFQQFQKSAMKGTQSLDEVPHTTTQHVPTLQRRDAGFGTNLSRAILGGMVRIFAKLPGKPIYVYLDNSTDQPAQLYIDGELCFEFVLGQNRPNGTVGIMMQCDNLYAFDANLEMLDVNTSTSILDTPNINTQIFLDGLEILGYYHTTNNSYPTLKQYLNDQSTRVVVITDESNPVVRDENIQPVGTSGLSFNVDMYITSSTQVGHTETSFFLVFTDNNQTIKVMEVPTNYLNAPVELFEINNDMCPQGEQVHVTSGKLDGDTYNDLVFACNSEILRLSGSELAGVEQGAKLILSELNIVKQAVDSNITGIQSADVDNDGIDEVIVGSLNADMSAYNMGTLGEPVYTIEVVDSNDEVMSTNVFDRRQKRFLRATFDDMRNGNVNVIDVTVNGVTVDFTVTTQIIEGSVVVRVDYVRDTTDSVENVVIVLTRSEHPFISKQFNIGSIISITSDCGNGNFDSVTEECEGTPGCSYDCLCETAYLGNGTCVPPPTTSPTTNAPTTESPAMRSTTEAPFFITEAPETSVMPTASVPVALSPSNPVTVPSKSITSGSSKNAFTNVISVIIAICVVFATALSY